MDYVLVFATGVLVTVLVMAKPARRMLVLVCVIGALFGGAAIYASTQPPAPATTTPSPALPPAPAGSL